MEKQLQLPLNVRRRRLSSSCRRSEKTAEAWATTTEFEMRQSSEAAAARLRQQRRWQEVSSADQLADAVVRRGRDAPRGSPAVSRGPAF